MNKKELVKALAQKDYDKHFLKQAYRQKRQIEKVLDSFPDMQLGNVYDSFSSKKKMWVEPYIVPDEQFVKKWQSKQYKGKAIAEDIPVILTEKGEQVRSKSEKIIADKLYSMGIPYRCECPIKLKGLGIVYPDFTLLNVLNRKEVYFEHFGMMDEVEYCRKAINKIEQYERNGIYIGKNLIVTFETSKQALNMTVVERMIENTLV